MPAWHLGREKRHPERKIMAGINRSTEAEVLVRFRDEFELPQEGLGRDFGL